MFKTTINWINRRREQNQTSTSTLSVNETSIYPSNATREPAPVEIHDIPLTSAQKLAKTKTQIQNLRALINENLATILDPIFLNQAFIKNTSKQEGMFEIYTDHPFHELARQPADPFLVIRFKEMYYFLDKIEFLLTEAMGIFQGTDPLKDALIHPQRSARLFKTAQHILNMIDANYHEFVLLLELVDRYRIYTKNRITRIGGVLENGKAGELLQSIRDRMHSMVSLFNEKKLVTSVSIPDSTVVQINSDPIREDADPLISMLKKLNNKLKNHELDKLIITLNTIIRRLANLYKPNNFLYFFDLLKFWSTLDSSLGQIERYLNVITDLINTDDFRNDRLQCYHQLSDFLYKADQTELFLGIKPGLLTGMLSSLSGLMNFLNPLKETNETYYISELASYPRMSALFTHSHHILSQASLTTLENNLKNYSSHLIYQGGLTASSNEKMRGEVFEINNSDETNQTAILNLDTMKIAIQAYLVTLVRASQDILHSARLISDWHTQVQKNIVQLYPKNLGKIEFGHNNNDKEEKNITNNANSLIKVIPNSFLQIQAYISFYKEKLRFVFHLLSYFQEGISSEQNLNTSAITLNQLIMNTWIIIKNIENNILNKVKPDSSGTEKFILFESIALTKELIVIAKYLMSILSSFTNAEIKLISLVSDNIFSAEKDRIIPFGMITERLSDSFSQSTQTISASLSPKEKIDLLIQSILPNASYLNTDENQMIYATLKAAPQETRQFWMAVLRKNVYEKLKKVIDPKYILYTATSFRLDLYKAQNSQKDFFTQVNTVLDFIDAFSYVTLWLKNFNDGNFLQNIRDLGTLPQFIEQAKLMINLTQTISNQVEKIFATVKAWDEKNAGIAQAIGDELDVLLEHPVRQRSMAAILTVTTEEEKFASSHSINLIAKSPADKRAISSTALTRYQTLVKQRTDPVIDLFNHVDSSLQKQEVVTFVTVLGKDIRELRKIADTAKGMQKIFALIRATRQILSDITPQRVSAVLNTLTPQDKKALHTIIVQLKNDILSLKSFVASIENEYCVKPGLLVDNMALVLKLVDPILALGEARTQPIKIARL